MGTTVFVNGQGLSGKASSHKVLGSMPDVCLSPPSPPAGPVPIPYPNFAKASDTTGGSKSVKMGGKEIGLKGKSKYKKSNGDEAATRSFGAGVISHSITGSVKHKAGSFDVKIEGAGAVRFMDLTTGNHSNPGDGCATIDTDTASPPIITEEDCESLHVKNEEERSSLKEAKQKRDSTKEHKTVQGAAGGNTTISHAIFRGGGEVLKAASKAVIQKYDNAFSKGLKPGTVDSKACGGHKYKKSARPHTSHTESRIIEDIFSKSPPPTGGTLVFAINWPGAGKGKAKAKRSCDPCDDCQKLICAVTNCLNIVICNDDNEPEEPDCPQKQ